MADIPEWKKVLQEPNAMGWIGLMVLVVLIGFGTLYFGGQDKPEADPPVSHAAK